MSDKKRPYLQEKKLYTPKQIFDLFNITRPTANKWAKNGVLDKVNIPGQRRVYFTAKSVDRLLTK